MDKEKDKKKKPTSQPKAPEPPPQEEEKSLDFGGLPARNLKKNLGCG